MKLILHSAFILCFTACQLDHGQDLERPYNEQTKELKLENFNEVFISGAAKATIQQGAYKIIVTGDSTDLTFFKPNVISNQFKYELSSPNKKVFGLQFQIFLPEIKILNISGATNVTVGNFNSKNFTVDVSGASVLNAYENIVHTLNINSSGATKAFVYASDELNANLSGASKLTYRGNPKVNSKSSGASVIQKD